MYGCIYVRTYVCLCVWIYARTYLYTRSYILFISHMFIPVADSACFLRLTCIVCHPSTLNKSKFSWRKSIQSHKNRPWFWKKKKNRNASCMIENDANTVRQYSDIITCQYNSKFCTYTFISDKKFKSRNLQRNEKQKVTD